MYRIPGAFQDSRMFGANKWSDWRFLADGPGPVWTCDVIKGTVPVASCRILPARHPYVR